MQGVGMQRSRFVIAAAISVLVAASVSTAEPFEPTGAWYVLVHSEEEEEGKSWADRVWVFEQRGSRLEWTEYPVVVLRDSRGRSEVLPSGREVKAAGHWRPNPAQRTEISSGPGVVTAWARSKTLRGSAGEGYRSRGAINRESTSVIGYSERWEIDGAGRLPIFRRRDELSGGRAEALDGLVEYRATKRDAEAIEGDFIRDLATTGRFRMERIGPPRPVEGEGAGEETDQSAGSVIGTDAGNASRAAKR